jgi:trehalose-phosphatase
MRVLNPDLDVEQFFRHVKRASERVLLLDYDGTLAPFHKRPEWALPYPRVADILKQGTRRRSTRVVIVSGRRLADLRGPLARIGLREAWAAHGWEQLTAEGECVDYQPTNLAKRQLLVAEARARGLGMHGVRVERKAASVAVHWRGVPRYASDLAQEKLRGAWHRIEGGQLDLLEFEDGIELLARGHNKGGAVLEVLSNCSKDAACAYLGNDTTDEDAFAAVKSRGLAVLVRPGLRPTCADLWLEPPHELVAFLEQWCAGGEAH